MKKILFFAAIAATALCSCQKQTGAEATNEALAAANNNDEVIVFNNYVPENSKATSVVASEIETNGFGVFAYSQGQKALKDYVQTNYIPNFMYNQKVTKNGTNWEYTPVKYWPNNPGALVSFLAYAPYISEFSSDEHTITPEISYPEYIKPVDGKGVRLVLDPKFNGPAIEYTVPEDPTAGVDLFWGAETGSDPALCPCNKLKPGKEEKINFNLKHALSRIAFDVQVLVDSEDPAANKGLADGTTIYIKKVSLKGNFASSGTLCLYDGTWKTSYQDRKNIVYTAGQDPKQFSDIVENGISADQAKSAVALLAGIDVDDPATGATKNNYLMAIPGAQFYIEIEYDVETIDPANPKNNSTVTNVITSCDPQEITKYYTLEQGKAYTFHLRIGMISAKIDATVTDWGTVTEQIVDLPSNVVTP